MSCSSRAIRSRSAIAVWAAAWARTSSARAWACRIEFPMSQAMIVTRGTAIVTRCYGRPARCRPGATPERALPGAGSAGRRRPWLRRSPRLCGCVSPLCSRSRGPLRRRPRSAGCSPALGFSAMAGHRSAEQHGQRRERPAAQQEGGSQQGAAEHRNPHMIMGASSLLGHAHGSDRSRLAGPGRLPAGIRPRADRGTAQMCPRADAARPRTAAPSSHGTRLSRLTDCASGSARCRRWTG